MLDDDAFGQPKRKFVWTEVKEKRSKLGYNDRKD